MMGNFAFRKKRSILADSCCCDLTCGGYKALEKVNRVGRDYGLKEVITKHKK